MKMKRIGMIVAVLLGSAAVACAQPRPASGPRPASSVRPQAGRGVAIKGMRGIRASDRLKTPQYTTSMSERSSTRQWGCISVDYETADDWLDELEVRYFVLVQHPVTKVRVLFVKNVPYIEIAKGKHTSTVFLRPNSLDRYGSIERAAAEIWVAGQKVAWRSLPEDNQPWWQTAVVAGNIRVMDNILMNRAETPFALIAYDSHETIKPK